MKKKLSACNNSRHDSGCTCNLKKLLPCDNALHGYGCICNWLRHRPPIIKLTTQDTSFLLWCLGYIYSLSDKLDKPHQEYIKNNHDRILEKIAEIHDSIR